MCLIFAGGVRILEKRRPMNINDEVELTLGLYHNAVPRSNTNPAGQGKRQQGGAND